AVMRGHIALSFTVNRTIFEDCRCRAEYEIDVALDVTVFEIMTTAVDEQGVLPSEKSTILNRRTIGVHEQRDRLRASAERVFKRQVLSVKIVCIDERAERESRVAGLKRAQAIS